MKSFNLHHTVPKQAAGSQMDVIEEREMGTISEAEKLFKLASMRLLTVSKCCVYAGISDFQLIGSKGEKLDRTAETGDYIRINIPGPGTYAGRGYDWVRIEEILEESNEVQQITSMRVRPCEYPLSDEPVTAHFLQNDATSTFQIGRSGNKVSAEEHGRNEKLNTSDGNLLDRGRNLMVGMAAKFGLSYPQWKSLVNGFLDEK